MVSRRLAPPRRLGQNFLADPNLLDAIVRDAGIGPADVVLEFGAGEGVLTERLARPPAHLHAVEIDRGSRASPRWRRSRCGRT